MAGKQRKYPVPSTVAGRAHSEGELGLKWLENLDTLVDSLAEKWHIRMGETLNGGSHALVLLQIGDDELANRMLRIAEAWCE